MVYVLALGAALANALTSVFQRLGVESAPAAATLMLILLTYALRRGIWLLGFALMMVSFLLQAVALRWQRELDDYDAVEHVQDPASKERRRGLMRTARRSRASVAAAQARRRFRPSG